MKKFLFAVVAISLAVVIVKPLFKRDNSQSVAGQQVVSEQPKDEVMGIIDDKLEIEDVVVGNGDDAVSGKKVTVNYKGTIEDGEVFDSSYDRGVPFTFNLGAKEVIRGWDEGVSGMKVGGKRKLTIPSSLGYGEQGIPGAIPPNSTLVFEVELLKVE